MITFAHYLCVLGRVPFLEENENGSNYNGDGSEKDAKKLNLHFGKLYSNLRHLLNLLQEIFAGVESLRAVFRFKKQKENLPCLHVLHKILHKEFPEMSHSGPVDIK